MIGDSMPFVQIEESFRSTTLLQVLSEIKSYLCLSHELDYLR